MYVLIIQYEIQVILTQWSVKNDENRPVFSIRVPMFLILSIYGSKMTLLAVCNTFPMMQTFMAFLLLL